MKPQPGGRKEYKYNPVPRKYAADRLISVPLLTEGAEARPSRRPRAMFKFHAVHGSHVALEDDDTCATRREGFCNGITFRWVPGYRLGSDRSWSVVTD